ncbi:MAG: AAA family ATPase [Calditrichaeota bacterium]|nr:AAA family ATPase [Calditrichota bacterium]
MDTKDKRLIRQVRLQNLLSFGPDTPPLELENLNVLIGPNGCGKSNFIEAISLMRSTPGKIWEVIRDGGGTPAWLWKGEKNADSAKLEFSFVYENKMQITHSLVFKEQPKFRSFWLFNEMIKSRKLSSKRLERMYSLKSERPNMVDLNLPDGTSRGWSEEFRQEQKSIIARRNDPKNYPELSFLSNNYSNIKIYKDWIFGLKNALRGAQLAEGQTEWVDENFLNIGLILNRCHNDSDAEAKIVDSMNLLYEGVSGFHESIHVPYVDFYFKESNKIIPSTRLSDGTLRWLCLMVILNDPDPPPLICIEEPELGLHPDILPTLADHLIAASERTQLIVTTHSDILVDAMSERPEAVVVCEKHDGKTEMNRLDKKSLKVWLDKYRLGQLWLKGELGGKRW